MTPDKLYQERIVSKWTLAIASITTLGFLFAFLYQNLGGVMCGRPAPNWFLLLLFFLFLALTINFSTLRIVITPAAVVVSYGVFRKRIPFHNIQEWQIDDASMFAYGGWGIRIARVGGNWRLVYNVIESPRLVLSLTKGKFREFVFSTKNPQRVMEIIRRETSRQDK
ncbi:MAG: hypothetical protein ABIK47_04750 [candidate division WOR-3 bacterium]